MWRFPRRGPAALLTLTLLLGLVGPVAPAVAYPDPGPLPPILAADLPARYLATGAAVADARAVARAAGDGRRLAALAALADWDLLEFDGRGNGRAVGVVGDLAGAERIAVLVPGAHTTVDNFTARGGPGGAAQALAEEAGTVAPGARLAVVAWLGYDTPQGLSPQALTDDLARGGVAGLRHSVAAIRGVNPGAEVSLLCHSYGSVLCAAAAADLAPTELVLYGSPGVGVDSVAALRTSARVWVGRSDRDWIRFVPAVRLAGVGFGRDPAAPEFGARQFSAGAGGHGDYHVAGGVALRSLALIVLGAEELGAGDA